jgi:hypothetical protein
MAPGVWVKLDCGPSARVARALPLRFADTVQDPTGPLPPAVDLRALGYDGPIKNQVGACTAFSLSTVMDSAVRKLGYQDTISALHVWSNYGRPNMGAAGDENVNGMLALDPTWPYDAAKACKFMDDGKDGPVDECGDAYDVVPGSAKHDVALMSEKRRADSSGRFRLEAVEEFSRPANTNEMAAVLAGGDAIWIALNVNLDAWHHRKDGVIPDYTSIERVGHAVALIGYRLNGNGRQFLIHNSWGPKWGQSGYGWISEAMIRKHTRSAYKVRVSDGSAPLPTPPSVSGCPVGQTRDAVLRTCAAVCASGSAPAAGVCLPTIPGFPLPQIPGQPTPPSPQPNPPAPGGACAQGQGVDPMTRQCAPFCPNGFPPIGGMCLPLFGPPR